MTIYFKSCGLATKALDTLHMLHITMSQKWSYNGIQTLSEKARKAMTEDMSKYPWFGMHDNVNIAFKIYEQRLNNQSHFDSGTAGTIILIKDPACIAPNYAASQMKFIEGANNPITFKDIISLESKASEQLKAFAVHLILKFLTDAPEFDFDNYKYNDSAVFTRPTSTCQLQTGPTSATCQYMLDLLHIDEVSYEGNDRVLEEWFRQVKLDEKSNQLVVWAGDQLTVSRIRGLKKFRCMDLNSHDRLEFLKPVFGWFHFGLGGLLKYLSETSQRQPNVKHQSCIPTSTFFRYSTSVSSILSAPNDSSMSSSKLSMGSSLILTSTSLVTSFFFLT